MCLNEAVSISKPEHSPLYIVNPLERGLNVSKNMSIEEVERFKVEVRNAAWLLESREYTKEKKGLLAIFEAKQDLKQKFNFTFSPKNNRLMQISALFSEEAQGDSSKQVEYVNPVVEKEIKHIKKETQENIKALERKNTRQKWGR